MGGVKFCLASADTCSMGAHAKKVDVHPSHVYINAGRNAAYTDLHVSSTAFGSALPNLMSELHPREDWLIIFQGFLEDSIPEVLTGTLVTPRKRKFRYLPDPVDILGAVGDSPLTSLTSWDADQPELAKNIVTALQKLENCFADFQVAVGEDVDALFSKLQDIKVGMGVKPVSLPIDGFSEDCVTIWETLTIMSGCQLESSKIQQLESTIQKLQSTTSAFGNKLQVLETGHSELSELGQLLNFEHDQLNQAVQHLGSGGSSLSTIVMDELLALQQQVSSLMQSSGGIGGSHDLGTLKAQLKLLEARLPSDPFIIGGRTFNSKADVALFVEKELSGLSFSLFHDPITLLESISDGQSKKSYIMASMYQASRVGFDEDEATHIHSFKLIVPSLLGATKEGDKNYPKYPLLAVKDFSSWKPQDNERGVKKRLQDGMDDVSFAVTESINVSCADHPAASKLAIEMLYQMQVFINELCSWVDSFYLELINTSQVPASEAWLLVASCIRRFCGVLRKF
jgi:hypothetical protein